MASSGYLVSPKQEPSKEQLWTETWKRIDRFLPDLRGELALDVEEEPGKVEEGKEDTAPEPDAEVAEEKKASEAEA